MIGQARFTYTDDDMIATQRAGLTAVRWRDLMIVYSVLVAFLIALLAGLNAAYGTRSAPAAPVFVIVVPALTLVFAFGLLFFGTARKYGRQVLHGDRSRFSWDGDEVGGEHTWVWDVNALHMYSEHGRADLPWASVGAWVNAPEVLVLLPSGERAFTLLPSLALAEGWQDAPKVFLFPFGGHALTLPKRVLAARDADHLVGALRAAGVQEWRRFGLPTSSTRNVHLAVPAVERSPKRNCCRLRATQNAKAAKLIDANRKHAAIARWAYIIRYGHART